MLHVQWRPKGARVRHSDIKPVLDIQQGSKLDIQICNLCCTSTDVHKRSQSDIQILNQFGTFGGCSNVVLDWRTFYRHDLNISLMSHVCWVGYGDAYIEVGHDYCWPSWTPQKGGPESSPPPPPSLMGGGGGGVYCTYIHTNIQNMLLEVLHDK